MADRETLEQFMRRLHCAHTSFDEVAKWYWLQTAEIASRDRALTEIANTVSYEHLENVSPETQTHLIRVSPKEPTNREEEDALIENFTGIDRHENPELY